VRRVRDAMYAEAVRQFDESHEAGFGLQEQIGEDWGMRGTFRTNLRLILYSE
jgi:hypothetical protein